jgi:hypothetical protein
MFGNHTRNMRQPAIIRLFASLVWLALPGTAVTAGSQDQASLPGAACVSCVILAVPAVSAASIEAPPGTLEGLTVVVDPRDPLAAQAVARLAAAGARPGLVIGSGAPPPRPELLRQAGVLIVRGLSDDSHAVFGLRDIATAARSARPGIRVLAAGDVPERALAYVDGRVVPGSPLAVASVGALVEASHRGGADLVLIAIEDVDWKAVADFASQRALRTEVVAAGTLTADQIVARHQAQRRRQEELVRRTIARGTTALLFEVPGFAAPVTVTARTTIFRQPDLTEIEQRDIRVNGAAAAGGDASTPPRLPLIEPERVATPPLVITLDDAYRYEHAGRERIDESEAYIIRFEPRGEGPRRARGRAWIDAASFALRRLETVQLDLHGAIVASEQHDVFKPFPVGREAAWLVVETKIYQMYEGAGHRTPIHRTIETPDYSVNPEDFSARLEAAHASPHVMLRETPQGFRYLLRSADSKEDGARALAPRAGERIRTAVAGVLVDPNITTPLPFAGLSYVDLNLFDTGTQLNAFFGGTYGQLSWSAPSIGRSRWQMHGRAFVIAARYNDRAFDAGVERYRENITQRPAHIAVGVARPLLRRLRARLDYALDYTSFDRADTTATTFVVPNDAIVHGLLAALEAESGPWTLRAWWNPAHRQGWQAWGEADRPPETASSFQRFGIAGTRTLALSRAVASRVQVEWVDGSDLDRFSRYSFGAFDNPLRGYPTASIRYDRGAVLRTATSFTGRGFRLDAFGDVAAVRDPGFGNRLRGYPGLGLAVEAGGPFRTLWSVEWGYGFEARRSDGGKGTQALRVTAYRTF